MTGENDKKQSKIRLLLLFLNGKQTVNEHRSNSVQTMFKSR